MGNLFHKNEGTPDSVYERRKARGVLAEQIQFNNQVNRLAEELQEQRRLVQELSNENYYLRAEIQKMQEEVERMTYVHSIDDLIDAMGKEKKAEASFNPFAGLFAKPVAKGTGTDSGNTGSDGTDKMLAPEQFSEPVPDDDAEIADEEISEDDVEDTDWNKDDR